MRTFAERKETRHDASAAVKNPDTIRHRGSFLAVCGAGDAERGFPLETPPSI